MKHFAKTIIFLLILLIPKIVAAETKSDFPEAKKIYMAAAACMAAYSNRTASLASAAFEQEGWVIESFRHADEKAESRYLLAWNTKADRDKEVFLLAVAGTENRSDVKVDLRANKVYFAGSTLEEFVDNAGRKDIPANVPRVHEGFNQAAQVLLTSQVSDSRPMEEGEKRLLSTILKERPADKLYLVGHSLGGAVVTLVAARLLDMGIDPGQIEVITFGAPAVGNEEFQQTYNGKFSVTRIVIDGDPVPVALRRVFGGYRHIGREINWKLPEVLIKRFSHDVPLYVDMSTRNFLAKQRELLIAGTMASPDAMEGIPRLFVTSVQNKLPAALNSEFVWMQAALQSEYRQMSPGTVIGVEPIQFAEAISLAKEAKADFLVIPEIQAVRVREENTWYVSLHQSVFRVNDGQLIHMGIYGSHTKYLTPLLVLIHGAKSMRAESITWFHPNG